MQDKKLQAEFTARKKQLEQTVQKGNNPFKILKTPKIVGENRMETIRELKDLQEINE